MAEQWRDIAGYDGVYQVSDQGESALPKTSKILQPVKLKNERLYVTLSNDSLLLLPVNTIRFRLRMSHWA